MSQLTFVYTPYINSTPEKVWRAITDPWLRVQYRGHANVYDWQQSSRWEHQRDESGIVEIVGVVVESEPPRKLVLTGLSPWRAVRIPPPPSLS